MLDSTESTEATRERLAAGYRSVETQDRERGILSQADRKYLRIGADGWKADNTAQSRSLRKQAIRQRTTEAIRDFSLLAVWKEDADMLKIADELSDDAPDHSVMTAPGGGDRGMVGMIAFLTRLCDGDLDVLERIIRGGIADGLGFDDPDGDMWSVDIDIDATRTRPTDEIQEKVENDDIDDLSGREAKQALSIMAGE